MRVKSIILATDEGKNMKSNKAKVLHKMLGKTLMSYSVEAIREMGTSEIGVLIGHKQEEIKNSLGDKDAYTFLEESRITQVSEFIGHGGDVIVLNGDMPLITGKDLKEALIFHRKVDHDVTVLSAQEDELGDYGKVYICKAKVLSDILLKEYCLQDAVQALCQQGRQVADLLISDVSHLLRINSKNQLAKCTQIVKQQINEKHMDNGVTIEDPQNTYIGPDVIIGYDTIIEPNCILRGRSVIGSECVIGCNSKIENSIISNGVQIQNSVIYESFVDDYARIGPFAYIRPNSKIGKSVKIGDFVEIKNSSIGDHTSVSHLTYIGDADVGKHVNFGCGSVLVNYDSVEKHRSTVEDHAFIGCNTNLISPVTIGERAYTAAGSTITKDVPQESLGIGRARQVNKEGWVTHKYPKK